MDDRDRHAYQGWLHDALRRERCRLHAYVPMTNHIHLLLTPSDARSAPRLLIAVGRRYVQHIDRTYGRTGTLWDSRCKSSLVQAETYLLLCQRYIELNPVRTGMIADPADYRWSSDRANAPGVPKGEKGPPFSWLESLVGAPERLERLAAFIVEHWEKRRAAMEGKAMVVTMSRDIAARLYEPIRVLRPA